MWSRRGILLLKFCVSVTAFSRGWLTWKWDSSIRSLIWNEDWWGEKLDWQRFAEHSDTPITQGLEVVGLSLMALSLVPWLTTIPRLTWTRWLLLPMCGVLFLDALGQFINSGNQFGMAIEHTLQWSCPLLLLGVLRGTSKRNHLILAASIGAALTFIGHGLYAAGFHPVPLKYQTMTMSLLGIKETGAMIFLRIAGYLDFLAALGIFLPLFRPLSLWYMIGWGAATAMARVASGSSLDPWLIESLVRTSHWMIPLWILLDGLENAFKPWNRAGIPGRKLPSSHEETG